MEVLHAKCAGLDVHKETVVACVRLVSGGRGLHEVRTFGTTTKHLLALSDWLGDRGCTHVAMEATGVYWKPVWHVLDGSFELVLASARHIRNVPGRKTDTNDAAWISDLLAHGLIRSSFVPEGRIQDLRTLTRTRKQLVREKVQHAQRIQKTLEDANLKIASAISDILGKSGRAILEALIAGNDDPHGLAALVDRRIKSSPATLVEALRGNVTRTHRFLLELHLGQVKALDASIDKVEEELGVLLDPFRSQAELLTTIPGISHTLAQTLIAEIGVDMSRFPTAGHLVSWAGLCPRNDESAGKRRSTRLRHGAPWLKTAMVQGAWSAVRTKGTYLNSQFLRLKTRRGPKKAVVAVAASMLTAAFHMLRDGTVYADLGADHFERADRSKAVNRLVRRLDTLGYQVAIKAAA